MKTRRESAFTLIEIMVVVAIVAIMLTLSYPAIREAVHRGPLTQAVLDITKGCRKARERAILSGKPAELRFYQDGRIEVADAPVDADPNANSSAGSQPAAPVSNTPETAPRLNSTAFSAQLSDSVAISKIFINFVDYMHTDGARVVFYPNGTSDEFTMEFISAEGGERRLITLEVVTGLAEVKAL